MEPSTAYQPETSNLQGEFRADLNRDKKHGDRRPEFKGTVTIPGSGHAYEIAVWAKSYTDRATGKTLKRFSGRSGVVSRHADPSQQLDALIAAGAPEQVEQAEDNITVAPGELVLFENKYRDQAVPDANGHTPNRPHFYGRWNPGNGEKIVALSVWTATSKGRYTAGQVVLTGFSQYPQPGKEQDLSADGAPAAPKKSRKREDATQVR